MHEFSLAMEITDITVNAAIEANKNRVVALTLEIGKISGVEEMALLSAFEVTSLGTIAEGAKVHILRPEGLAVCVECNLEYAIEDTFSVCPKCNSYMKKILSGKEFRVMSIEAE